MPHTDSINTDAIGAVKVTTNNHYRELLAVADLPASARADFDYLEGDEYYYSPRIFRYRGDYWDAGEFTVSHIPGWEGEQAQSVWDAIVIRYSDDYEAVAVGHATW